MTDRIAALLPAGLSARLVARPLTMTDAEAVVDLMTTAQVHDDGEVMVDLEDIVGDWQRPSFDLATESVGLFDGERLVAYAEVYRARRAEVYVTPDLRGRGIGTALLTWTQKVARGGGGSLVGQTVSASLAPAIALFRRHGYTRRWTSWVLELSPDAEIAPVELPTSTRIREFEPGPDERVAYRVIEDAFNEWPGREPATFDDWAAGTLHRPGFAPWMLQLAEVRALERPTDHHSTVEQGWTVVGACYVLVSGDVGWVHQLAVRRDARGRGLARALLLRAFAETRARGCSRCQLSTDSRTGALGLYEHVGMRVRSEYVHYAKEI